MSASPEGPVLPEGTRRVPKLSKHCRTVAEQLPRRPGTGRPKLDVLGQMLANEGQLWPDFDQPTGVQQRTRIRSEFDRSLANAGQDGSKPAKLGNVWARLGP